MKFWDTSCIVPLCLNEPSSGEIQKILKDDPAVIVWWGTRIEAIWAMTRRMREGVLDATSEDQARNILFSLSQCWTEVQPTQRVREISERLLAVHLLRTENAL